MMILTCRVDHHFAAERQNMSLKHALQGFGVTDSFSIENPIINYDIMYWNALRTLLEQEDL